MTATTTISNNSAHFGGGIWIGLRRQAKLTNDTIAGNTATMGGGVWFAGGVTGTLQNVTVAANAGNGMAGGDTGVSRCRTRLSRATRRAALEGEVSCDHGHAGAGANMEFPGDSKLAPGTPSVLVADPELGPLEGQRRRDADDGSCCGSPAIGKGSGCPTTDQTGQTRKTACTLGAVGRLLDTGKCRERA